MRKWGLLVLVSTLVIAVAIVWKGSSAELRFTYEMSVLIEAKYGDGTDEFGMKSYGGDLLGAVCFDVDSSGSVYIYDGPKGDVKVYDADGAYVKTVEALPWIVGEQMLADMAVGPRGDIYLAMETGRLDERMKIWRISAADGEPKALPIALSDEFAMKDGVHAWFSVWLTVDGHGGVHLVDRHSGRTMTLLTDDKVLSAEGQLGSLRKGLPMKSGHWVVRGKTSGPKDETSTAVVYDKDGTEVSRFLSLRGPVVGVDSEGRIYVDVAERKGKQLVFSTRVLSPQGELEGIIDSPYIPMSAKTFGKGTRQLFAADGSAYELVGTRHSVKIYKWQRIASDREVQIEEGERP